MPCTIAALPQELLDYIIDLAAAAAIHDKRAAGRLTLTCRAWAPRASTHLFAGLCLLAKDLPALAGHTQRSPRLARHLTTLVLAEERGAKSTPIALADLDAILALPALRSLALVGRSLSISAGAGHEGNHRRKLAHMRLSRVYVDVLPALLGRFTRIDTLELEQLHVPARAPHARHDAHLAVGTLILDGGPAELGMLSAALDATSLKRLTLKSGERFRVDPRPVDALLRAAGTNIEYLRIDMPLDAWGPAGPGLSTRALYANTSRPEARSGPSALRNLAQLHTLELVAPRRAPSHCDSHESTMLWERTLAMLRGAPPGVRRIRLHASLDDFAPAASADCGVKALERNLEQCDALESVELVLADERRPGSRQAAAELQDAVRGRMKAGLAKIVCIS